MIDKPKIWPLTAPGMPPVGMDFIDAARELGDTETVTKGTGKKFSVEPGQGLIDLVERSLYDRGRLKIKISSFATQD